MTLLEKTTEVNRRNKQLKRDQWYVNKAKKSFPDLKSDPYVDTPLKCKLPWWIGFGHKEYFFHGDEYGVLTSMYVCLRCGLVAFRFGGGEFEHQWDEKAGYTNPNNPQSLAEDEE